MGTVSSSYRNGYIDALKLVLELVEELEHDGFIDEEAMLQVRAMLVRLLREMQTNR